MPEQLFNQGIDIRHIGVEDRPDSLDIGLDLKKDLLPIDHDRILSCFKSDFAGKRWYDATHYAAGLSLLFPDTAEVYVEPVLDSLTQSTVEYADGKRREGLSDSYVQVLAHARLFNSSKVSDLLRAKYTTIRQTIEKRAEQRMTYHTVTDILYEYLVFPEIISQRLNDTSVNIDFQKSLEVGIPRYRSFGSWYNVGCTFVLAKLLFPDNPDLKPTLYDWEDMREVLNYHRKQAEIHHFTTQAIMMTLLSAQRLEVTPEGIEIKLPNTSNERDGHTELPSQRSY